MMNNSDFNEMVATISDAIAAIHDSQNTLVKKVKDIELRLVKIEQEKYNENQI